MIKTSSLQLIQTQETMSNAPGIDFDIQCSSIEQLDLTRAGKIHIFQPKSQSSNTSLNSNEEKEI